jgi:hypothetical protein
MAERAQKRRGDERVRVRVTCGGSRDALQRVRCPYNTVGGLLRPVFALIQHGMYESIGPKWRRAFFGSINRD